MIDWIKSLFCFHKWKIINHFVVCYHDADTKEKTKERDKYILQCEKCGIIKRKEV